MGRPKTTTNDIRRREREERDNIARRLGPGDWVRFREHYSSVMHAGKLARIEHWVEDGFNESRAPRNKVVLVSVEPLLNTELPIFYQGKLQEFLPVSEMEVVAECARG